jgi:hypothetical protein
MKKLINSPDDVVADALAGIAAAHPGLSVDAKERVITRAAQTRVGKVALVSGGGSGHEPLHGGFVGPGMLDAACPGEVFTSPVPGQMLAAARSVEAGAGVVFVVKNYTGDVLNFRMAAELAEDEGLAVETVLVDDDVAVQDSTWTAGRRGTGATLFVEKIAGAAAERGASLTEVAELGRRVNAASRSFAVALTSCTTPAAAIFSTNRVAPVPRRPPAPPRRPGVPASTCRRTRSRSASASTASRGAGGRRSARRGRSSRTRWRRSSGTGRRSRATRSSCWSTDWAGRRCWSSTSSSARSPRCWRRAACGSPGAWSGTM